MRRLVGISIKSLGAAGLLLVGTIYVAAEARQAVIRLYATPNPGTPAQPAPDLASAKPATQPSFKPAKPQLSVDDERAAEQQASQLPAQKPSPAPDAHTRQPAPCTPGR